LDITTAIEALDMLNVKQWKKKKDWHAMYIGRQWRANNCRFNFKQVWQDMHLTKYNENLSMLLWLVISKLFIMFVN
jgi:hypothetical protein